jgi:hypothetical protein
MSTIVNTVAPGSLWGEEGAYDSILMSIMKDCGKIQPFFECIFSFLSRRTDFYIIMEHDHAEMGFPPGVALNMVIQAFKRFEILTRKREAELLREAETRRIELMTDDLSQQPNLDVPSSAVEHLSKLAKLKAGNSSEPLIEPHSQDPISIEPLPSHDIPSIEPLESPPIEVIDNSTKPSPPLPNDPPPVEPPVTPLVASPTKHSDTPTCSAPPTIPASPLTISSSSLPVQPPAAVQPPETVSTPPKPPPTSRSPPRKSGGKKKESLISDAYNGSKTDNYVWSQTMTDVDIRIPVPERTAGKAIRVDIKNDSLKVELMKPERKVVLNGRLLYKVKVEESMWSLDKDSCAVHINLEKNKEMMWKSVFEGEEGIDLTKVDTTRDISEFDAEAQAAIQKVTYDHHMKMLGKPTSDQQKAHDILKKAWDAPGSPFKGTPFDPSRVNITGVW